MLFHSGTDTTYPTRTTRSPGPEVWMESVRRPRSRCPSSAPSAASSCARSAGSTNCTLSAVSTRTLVTAPPAASERRWRTTAPPRSGSWVTSGAMARIFPCRLPSAVVTTTSAPRSAASRAASDPSALASNGRSRNASPAADLPGRVTVPAPPAAS